MTATNPALQGACTPTAALLKARLAKFGESLHRAYCMAVCLDRALRHNASDDSPELAVCVHEYLVRPLDALSIDATDLNNMLAAMTVAPDAIETHTREA